MSALTDTPDVVDEGSVRAYSSENSLVHVLFESVTFLLYPNV